MNITLDDGRTELWQWDTGRKIVVDDKSVSEVHYSKYSSTQAITREVIDGKAEIPNFLLQDTHAVTVYAYSGSIENGYTMAEKTFNVLKKPKPANYVETEEDKAILAKLKEAIGDLSELQTEAKDNLVSAINEAAASGGASEFVVNGTIGGETGVGYSITLDKTADQILAAINEGKSVIARVAYEITIDLPLVSFDTISGNIIFAGIINYMAMDSISPIIYFLRLRNDEATLYSSVAIALDSEGKLPQVSMISAPTSDMQIATKKYVDDHAGGVTDMGITGAAVGQIAKITAVDASGTPTAWGPADMPSGGGAITYDIAATAERSVQNNTLQGFKCSVSSKQLRKAIDAGKTPRLVIDIRTTIMYMPMTNYFLVGAEYAYVNFGCVDEYGLVSVVCDGESEVDAGKPIWLARSSFVTPTY